MSKIMILVHTYYPTQNGVQAVTQYIVEGLAQSGNQIIVVTALKDGYSEKENHHGVDIRRIAVHRKNWYEHIGDKKVFEKLCFMIKKYLNLGEKVSDEV